MFSQTVEYALRAMVYLAHQAPGGKTTEEIHAATLIKKAYLSKILQGLAKKGIVQTQRGVGGGITLARSPAQLTLLDIVNAIEPIKRIRTCPLGYVPQSSRLCTLHQYMDAALSSVEEAFRKATLAEIISETSECEPLCSEALAPQLLKLRQKEMA